MVIAPLFARGLVLGHSMVGRTQNPEPFDSDDVDLLEEIVSRAALSIDNARRYLREHRASVALQERLLPRAKHELAAVEAVGNYLPATGEADIGGDWFDVIPLPSLRVALVVGDVVGHGLHATATMGRLRTSVQTLCAGPDARRQAQGPGGRAHPLGTPHPRVHLLPLAPRRRSPLRSPPVRR